MSIKEPYAKSSVYDANQEKNILGGGKTVHVVFKYKLNMELDDRSPKFIWAPVYSCTHWLRPPQLPSPSAFGLIYEGAIGHSKKDEI